MKKRKNTEFDINEVIEVTKETNEKIEKKAKSLKTDFKKFVAKGNIVDLAVAVVVGTAFNGVVNSLVTNIITPLTSRILPKGDLSSLKIVLQDAVDGDEAAGIEAVPEIAVTYGIFIEKLIDFLIIALSIFFVMRVLLKLKRVIKYREIKEAEEKAKAAAAKKKAEEEAEAAKLEKIKNDFINDVAEQARVLNDIKDIMLRMENNKGNQD